MADKFQGLTIDPLAPVVDTAAALIGQRVAELLSWESYVRSPERVEELHNMRIAAKRLRYTMELFASYYGPEFKGAIGRVKKIQEQLGDIHDADVLLPELARYLGQSLRKETSPNHGEQTMGVYAVDIEAATGLLSLCRSRRESRDAVYTQFLQTWTAMRSEGFFDRLWVIANGKAPEDETKGKVKARKATLSGGQQNVDGRDGGSRNGEFHGAQAGVSDGPRLEPAERESIDGVRQRWRGTRRRVDPGPRSDSGEGAS